MKKLLTGLALILALGCGKQEKEVPEHVFQRSVYIPVTIWGELYGEYYFIQKGDSAQQYVVHRSDEDIDNYLFYKNCLVIRYIPSKEHEGDSTEIDIRDLSDRIRGIMGIDTTGYNPKSE